MNLFSMYAHDVWFLHSILLLECRLPNMMNEARRGTTHFFIPCSYICGFKISGSFTRCMFHESIFHLLENCVQQGTEEMFN